jgi:hypothetical protein
MFFCQRPPAAIMISPAAVSRSPVGSRSNSGMPRSASTFRICRSIAEAETLSSSAARRIEPRRPTARK